MKTICGTTETNSYLHNSQSRLKICVGNKFYDIIRTTSKKFVSLYSKEQEGNFNINGD